MKFIGISLIANLPDPIAGRPKTTVEAAWDVAPHRDHLVAAGAL